MLKLFLDRSIVLEQIHIFKISIVAELTVTGNMTEKGKLRVVFKCSYKEWELYTTDSGEPANLLGT